MNKPNYIAFEGLDCSGKSTITQMVDDYLFSLGLYTTLVAEPTKLGVGGDIRALLEKYSDTASSEVLNLLFAANRRYLIDTIIKPAMDKDNVVISDRCFLSGMVYQASSTWMYPGILSLSADSTLPQVIFILDVDPTTAIERLTGRGGVDAFETTDTTVLQKRREGYLAFAKSSDKCIVINATRDVESVFRDIKSHLDRIYLEDSKDS